MKPTAIRSALTFAGKMFTGVALSAALLCAQGQPDFANTQIKTTKVANNFYTLEGQGGMIGILTGPDGVFMVDTQFAPLSEKIAAAIKQVADKPVKFIVNTHVHGDHTGGNENFGKMGATLISREQLRDRLMHPAPGANGAPGTPAPAAALPIITYNGPVTFHMNGQDVMLLPQRAHTDGDTMVYFPGIDVIMTGDFYRSIQFPNIDRANGGSLQGMIDALGQVIARSGPNTKIIPGHGGTVDRMAVMAHRDMILSVRDKVSKMIDQGMTQEQVIAAKPGAEFTAKIQQVAQTEDRFVGQVYAELKGR
jgi:glyoxylase-like metal-dependent hydrolase (beta-lactamase superfamily II)